MSEEKNPPLEPRWHKRDTLTKLHDARRRHDRQLVVVKEAERLCDSIYEEAKQLEREAGEWMRRDNTTTEVVLMPSRVSSGEAQRAIVFKRNDYGSVFDTTVEPVR